MDIRFTGKSRAITTFEWNNIPKFAVITGLNGSGKSQLLEMIYNKLVSNAGPIEIQEEPFQRDEIVFQQSTWNLQHGGHLNMFTLHQKLETLFSSFRNNPDLYPTLRKNIKEKTGRDWHMLSLEEFKVNVPIDFIMSQEELPDQISRIFYDYHLSHNDAVIKGTENDFRKQYGPKPWIVLEDIVREAGLPFKFSNPEGIGYKDDFHFQIASTANNDSILFNELSSGEKVLISLLFLMYNSQSGNRLAKLFLLDEPTAHLHPSMTFQFLNVVKNVLVDKYGARVIMTTHSPSTIALSPDESIFILSKPTMIERPSSKNAAISILTSGLIFVGKNSKTVFVEDDADLNFYNFIFQSLQQTGKISKDIPVVFISASKRDVNQSGGKSAVASWVKKLVNSGLTSIIQGLIDHDEKNEAAAGVHLLTRYSIENYLADPILVYCSLITLDKIPKIEGINLVFGDENKLRELSSSDLQKIADFVFDNVKSNLNTVKNFDQITDFETTKVEFTNGKMLQYPKWLLKGRGKDIINTLSAKFGVHFDHLMKSMRRLKMIPIDLVGTMQELQNG